MPTEHPTAWLPPESEWSAALGVIGTRGGGLGDWASARARLIELLDAAARRREQRTGSEAAGVLIVAPLTLATEAAEQIGSNLLTQEGSAAVAAKLLGDYQRRIPTRRVVGLRVDAGAVGHAMIGELDTLEGRRVCELRL